MSYTKHLILCCLILAVPLFLAAAPAQAFTANSLDITVSENGDAIATFRFTLEGIIENAIPQSVLEEELKKGLTTSAEPPELRSMDKSSAVLLLKKFADTSDVPTGTEYRTATMDFKKAEIALQNSALSSAVSADFSPEKITLTFPDSYRREFTNVDVLPAVFHTVVDPSKTPRATTVAPAPGATAVPGVTAVQAITGSMNVTSSPAGVKVYLDSGYIGDAPALFPEIAPGTHTAEFRKDGYEPVSKSVTINSGKTTNVMVVLRYIPQAATEEPSSFPWLTVLVVVIVLVAVAAGGYYYWNEKKKNEWGEEETGPEDTGNRVSPAPENVPGSPAGTRPAAGSPEVSSTVVRVTMLKDIPDKGAGKDDAGNKQE